jgi:hypothetical protein
MIKKPKRYTNKETPYHSGFPHWESPNGEWVRWEDYALLKSELDRLQNNVDYLDAALDREIDKNAELAGIIRKLNDAIISGGAIIPDAKPVE